ncbi:MAG: restriction endonuclease subunit S [Defluviitaleaceae bacterium]|nr:restriction endonuclease subunit S [Defluviitaleaceae bacterium]
MSSVPEIRFEGFANDWEQRTVGKIISEKISNGIMNRPGRNELNVKHINVVNLYAPSHIQPNELAYFDATEKDLKKCNVEVGDIFLTRSSLKLEGIAQANILLDEGTYVFDDHIMRIKLAPEFEPFFIKEALNYSSIKKDFMAKAKTGTMTTIGQDDITSSCIIFPSKDEQVKLGKFFHTLDNTIAIYKRKLDGLKQLKKAYLQQMFPQAGETVPRLRFEGFTEPWEVRKLGEITSSYSGGTPSVGISKYYSGDIPFIRSAEINSKDTELYLTQEGLQNSSAKMVRIGDILYALYGATSGEVGISQIEGAINQAILAITPNLGYDSQFLMQWLRNNKQNIIDKYLQGGQGNLSGSIVKELAIYLPCYDEQVLIGSFFCNLDIITTQQIEWIKQLGHLKSAYLQKMFA